MMNKVLFVATVVKKHIMVFHLPYLEWFKKNGYETHVCASNDYDNKEDCVIPFCDKYFDLPFKRSPFNFNNINVYMKLKKIIDSNEYDIIHCHTPIGGVLSRLAAIKARRKGTKIIYTAHGFHFYKGAPIKNWLLYYPIERLLARYTDNLITINKEDFLRASNSFKVEKVEYVPGVGIDISRFSEIDVDQLDKRKELDLPKDAFVVLSVGELNMNKNHKTVIKAIAHLKNPNIYFVICGQGLLEKDLRRLIKELGLDKQVKLLGYRKDIIEICKASTVFAFPSYREGLSVALMEAMASGLPVICSDIRGNVDLIRNGKGGYLVRPNDIEGFADALTRLYQSEKSREDFRENNLDFIKKYSVENVIVEMEKIYTRVD